MSEIIDVIPGGDVESTWGNLIKDRTLMRYSNQAALDGSILTPNAGDFAYVIDEQAVKVWTGAAWITFALQVAGEFLPLAGGVMAGAIDMAGQSIVNAGALVDVTGVLNFTRTGVGIINMVRSDAAITDGNAQSNLRQSTADGFVLRTGSPDNITVPLTDRMSLNDLQAKFKNLDRVVVDNGVELNVGDGLTTGDEFWTTGTGFLSALSRAFFFTSMGNNTGWLAWNWMRTNGGYAAIGYTGLPGATSMEMGDTYVRFGVENNYTPDSSPSVRFTITESGGALAFGAGAELTALSASVQNLAAQYGNVVAAVAEAGDTIAQDAFVEVNLRDTLADILDRLEALEVHHP